MILLNDFKRQWSETSGDVLRAVESVGASGWYILGAKVRDFERDLGAMWGLPHTIGVASGLDAIELSLRALGCKPGDFVLTSPISAFATPLAILKLGAIPVFADCDEFGLVDLNACRRILASRRDIRYFVPVHLYGHCLDMNMLRALRDEFQLGIIEDCAQSIGARHAGTHCGTVGDFAATSFYPTKNLGALGDGGAVLTASEELSTKIRHLRDYGQSAKYRHDILGYNSRLDELQAAIMQTAFLPRLERWTATRRAIAARYRENLRSSCFAVPGAPAGSDSCWHLFPVLLNEPNSKTQIIQSLQKEGVSVAEHYPLALIDQEAITPFRDCFGLDTPNARAFCRREISLPIHPYLSDDEVSRVIDACNHLT
jgi:dTDP-3-amino-3,4,6-trideoxy-alpha-D-glucose transaminase